MELFEDFKQDEEPVKEKKKHEISELISIEYYNEHTMVRERTEDGYISTAEYESFIEMTKHSDRLNGNTKWRNWKIVNGKIQLKKGKLLKIDKRQYNDYEPGSGDVRIVTEFTEEQLFIKSNDRFFYYISCYIGDEFFENYRNLLYRLGKIKLCGNSCYICTDNHSMHINGIPTGIKAVLNVLYIRDYLDKEKEYYVNIDDCGDNIVPIIYDIIAGTNIIACTKVYKRA